MLSLAPLAAYYSIPPAPSEVRLAAAGGAKTGRPYGSAAIIKQRPVKFPLRSGLTRSGSARNHVGPRGYQTTVAYRFSASFKPPTAF